MNLLIKGLGISTFLMLGLGRSWLGTPAWGQTLTLEAGLTSLTSRTGESLLETSQAKADVLPLMSHFVTQINPAYCGVASSVMVLNALGVTTANTPAWQRGYLNQDTIFTPQTNAVIDRHLIAHQGLTLSQLAEFLQTYPVTVERYYGSDLGLAEFRQILGISLGKANQYILVNYLRSSIGQETGGHISPLAAYHAEQDQVLILDVARYKYPPIWVSVQALWQAMGTIDPVSGKSRGFLVIRNREPKAKN
ncbi:phytochelatin synthase family protein [Synechococcus sp. PCC 6312]|uniref:phytochelatin synthase family protein n=1 Tax=Synechococcus sp. (strain ATCC 27167 / PCC 6312) TaxID=195253 RepID=UPI00155ABC1F|nr:phytochelatin synthase family protein [Synechococcus sp. PCC 6312]